MRIRSLHTVAPLGRGWGEIITLPYGTLWKRQPTEFAANRPLVRFNEINGLTERIHESHRTIHWVTLD